MSTSVLTHTTTSRTVHRAGRWCLAAGILGVVQGSTLLAWSPQVSDAHYSYPFDGGGFAMAQVSFFVQHLLLIVGVAALLSLPAIRASRTARTGTWVSISGLLLLAVTELVAISAYDVATDSTHATLVNTLYGPSVILIGSGLLAAGVAMVRQDSVVWAGARWLPALVVVMGGYIVVLLIPSIMGSFTAGRLAISAWMLLFAVFGYGLTRLSGDDAADRS